MYSGDETYGDDVTSGPATDDYAQFVYGIWNAKSLAGESNMNTYDDDALAATNAEMEAMRAEYERVKAQWGALQQDRQVILDRIAEKKIMVALAESTPTTKNVEILQEIGWSNGRGNLTASAALERLYASFGPGIGMGSWYTAAETPVYAVPQLRLKYRQDTTETTEGLLRLCRLIQGVRPFVHVYVFEHTMSEYGSYGINLNPETGEATLYVMRHFSRSDLLTGTVAEVLARVARDHWYESGDESDPSLEFEPFSDETRPWS